MSCDDFSNNPDDQNANSTLDDPSRTGVLGKVAPSLDRKHWDYEWKGVELLRRRGHKDREEFDCAT